MDLRRIMDYLEEAEENQHRLFEVAPDDSRALHTEVIGLILDEEALCQETLDSFGRRYPRGYDPSSRQQQIAEQIVTKLLNAEEGRLSEEDQFDLVCLAHVWQILDDMETDND